MTPSSESNRSGDGAKEAAIGREKKDEIFLSPRFKSAAAMAGWDEEDLIIASFVVEDTPERSSSKRKRRSHFLLKATPPSSGSTRKKSSVPLPVVDLDALIRHEEEKSAEKKKKKRETKTDTQEENSTSVVLPCLDKLRDEFSCPICLEICFEPSTTTCGHSFCKKCLRSAADKCGRKCPQCRQLIGNGRSCTVNTVLWNTIQLLFPKEIEARRAAASANLKAKETPRRNRDQDRLQREEDLSRLLLVPGERRRGSSMRLNQDRDAALALQLQRQEFASAYRVTATASSSGPNVALARANLRAMASRAVRR